MTYTEYSNKRNIINFNVRKSSVGEDVKRRECIYIAGGIYIGTVTMENSMEISLKLRIELNYKIQVCHAEYLCKEYGNTKKIYASSCLI